MIDKNIIMPFQIYPLRTRDSSYQSLKEHVLICSYVSSSNRTLCQHTSPTPFIHYHAQMQNGWLHAPFWILQTRGFNSFDNFTLCSLRWFFFLSQHSNWTKRIMIFPLDIDEAEFFSELSHGNTKSTNQTKSLRPSTRDGFFSSFFPQVLEFIVYKSQSEYSSKPTSILI